jgi:23S rRNA pseudouridine1911/1915/1917 synthase
VGGGGEAGTPALRLRAGADDAGARLDAFLAGAADEVPSRAAAQRLIDAGAVEVDGEPRPKNHRLEPGAVVTVELPEAPPDEAADVPFDVVYEDEYLLVVDKPAGVVVHPAPGHAGPTLAAALADRAAGGPDPERAGIVHRLDRDTSGLMLVTRSEGAHRAMRQMMKAREVRREYLALVSGSPDTTGGTIDAPIGRDRVRRTVQSTRSDRPRAAVTHFRVLERLPRTTLLEVTLETGRTHQIRTHMSEIGHPVCGDGPYGGGECGARIGLSRQFLHAERLMFSHPFSREFIACESKPPVDLRRALDVARREPVSGGPDGG